MYKIKNEILIGQSINSNLKLNKMNAILKNINYDSQNRKNIAKDWNNLWV